MAKVFINANLDYVMGYLRYGHREGILDIPDEDIKKFEEEPLDYIEKNDLLFELKLIVDDFEIEGYGDVVDIDYNITKE